MRHYYSRLSVDSLRRALHYHRVALRKLVQRVIRWRGSPIGATTRAARAQAFAEHRICRMIRRELAARS